MSNKVTDMDMKNHTYYFFDDIINIKNFDSNNIKIDKNSYKHILIYYIGYVMIKDSKYVKINSVISLYLIFKQSEWWILWIINGNKYLMLVPTHESKEKLKNKKNCGLKSET